MTAKLTFTELLQTPGLLISDGAWGTFLQRLGLVPGQCPELWCVERPDDVRGIAASYIEAGADMVQTNTFGGNRFKLDLYGLAGQTVEINRSGARLSREAAGAERHVIASVGPTGKMLLTGEVTETQLRDAFKEQCAALAEGGADAICIETMLADDEAAIAVRAARDVTDCEVLCTFTFGRTLQDEFRTMMGLAPATAAATALQAGAHVIGANCGNGLEDMIEIIRQLRQAAPDTPVLVHANAGLPTNIDGVDVFPETPEQMAAQLPAAVKAGVRIVGGCCGTTPEHIRALCAKRAELAL